MGFFKSFKGDLSQAVNELMPGEENSENGGAGDELVVNTLENDVDIASELSKLDGLLEQVTSQASAVRREKPSLFETGQEADIAVNTMERTKEDEIMAENVSSFENQSRMASDEISVITEGTIIQGNIISRGSLDIRGEVQGDIECDGKIVATGTITGNSNSSEFFADGAKVEGEIISTGTVKIGHGSVIVGNIEASSAVIAGATKGDIDVKGPIVVDTTAVVMGNIKSRSIQINNGAVIEGFYSQCYNDVDVNSFFEPKEEENP